jgi:signal transduction histidine kinase
VSLRWRLTLLYLAASMAIFAGALLAVNAVFRSGIVASIDRTLVRALDQITESIELHPPDQGLPLQAIARFAESRESLLVACIDRDGQVLFASDADLAPVFAEAPRPREWSPHPMFRSVSLGQGRDWRAAWLPLTERQDVFLVIASALPSGRSLFASLTGFFMLLFGLILVVTLGWSGWIIAGRALAPIDHIAKTAELVSRGTLEERIPIPRKRDELGRLIEVLNGMLERVEAATRKLSHFASNVSHQLRTPLTVLRGEIEVALRASLSEAETRALLESNLVELESLSTLIEDLLAYARAPDEGRVSGAPASLDEWMKSVVSKARTLCRPKEIVLKSNLKAATAIFHAGRLEQAVLNIIDNAVKYTPRGGIINVDLEENGADALVRIRDSGPGLTAEAEPRLFMRGHTTGGTGIGLHLAKSLVESFDGRIEVRNALGQGLEVMIRLHKPA